MEPNWCSSIKEEEYLDMLNSDTYYTQNGVGWGEGMDRAWSRKWLSKLVGLGTRQGCWPHVVESYGRRYPKTNTYVRTTCFMHLKLPNVWKKCSSVPNVLLKGLFFNTRSMVLWVPTNISIEWCPDHLMANQGKSWCRYEFCFNISFSSLSILIYDDLIYNKVRPPLIFTQ